jgi:hypothetical protein
VTGTRLVQAAALPGSNSDTDNLGPGTAGTEDRSARVSLARARLLPGPRKEVGADGVDRHRRRGGPIGHPLGSCPAVAGGLRGVPRCEGGAANGDGRDIRHSQRQLREHEVSAAMRIQPHDW